MLRNFLKNRIPPPKRIRALIPTQLHGRRINKPVLWHLNRYSVARAAAIGLFCAYLPIPFEMVAATLLAILLRANLPISVLLVWISNPLTWMLIYTPPYLLGTALMGDTQVSFDSITVEIMLQQYASLLLGCLIFGVALAIGGYFIVIVLWRMKVTEQWQKRRKNRTNEKVTKK